MRGKAWPSAMKVDEESSLAYSLMDALPADESGFALIDALRGLSRRDFLQLSALPCAVWGAASAFSPGASARVAGEMLPEPKGQPASEARFYDKLPGGVVQCRLCPRQCVVGEGKRGHCRVRENRGGTYYTLAHSRICSAHIDPIEKKPFFHFQPGTMAFSVATGGCNVNCKFCQNWEISQARPEDLQRQFAAPADLAQGARQNRCPTLAYTYSEPIIAAEYYLETAEAGHQAGVKSVFVSNGYVRPEPLARLCERMDAIKIDLKAFSEKYYREVVNAELQPVLETILAVRKLGVWLELVYLVVPTLNDSDAELKAMSRWVKAELGADVPIHFSRFYPLYRLRNLPATPLETLERAKAIADAEGNHFVYIGNVPTHPAENTYCPKCRRVVIERAGFTVKALEVEKGKCRFCREAIPGVWG